MAAPALAILPKPAPKPRPKRKTPAQREAERLLADAAVVRYLAAWRTERPLRGPDDWMAVAHLAREVVRLLSVAERNGVDFTHSAVRRDLLALTGACARLLPATERNT